jgi:hypothetical protein
MEFLPGDPKLVTRAPVIPRIAGASREELVEESLRRLREYFRGLVDSFPAGFSSALSGGYGSRLMLGLLLEQGVAPNLFVYGKDMDDSVRVAKVVAGGEGLELLHIDRSVGARLSYDAFFKHVRRNFIGSDGYSYGGHIYLGFGATGVASAHCRWAGMRRRRGFS